ncbi:MAG: N-6 DNA methylase, partial [Bacilli bacterium]|nr:N-6 DNA methylase [Bacilli bacterium]
GISTDNIDIFSVKTGSKEKIKLFDNLSQYITESDKKNRFFKAIINKLVGFSFEKAFEEKYDFFATIFEYLIKDYNKDFGKYAEYYTPNSIARIIARILAPNPTQNVTLYDPAAGSGTLLLALAHQIGEDNCTIYSQDISQKSNEFLRLNLILNNLVHSLGNVIHGDTLLNPTHLNSEKNRLAQFDYIVSNPPFKTDFSETRDQLDTEKFKDRFFAGIPNIPNEKKDSMAIYLLFIQHIIYSLKENGCAAVVVPTGFLTAKNGIEFNIRKKLIENKWLQGVISMPSNIFANTGTNVSILFFSKKENERVMLVDATTLGVSEKVGKVKKTRLLQEEMNEIINTFVKQNEKQDFSVAVSHNKIMENNYLLNPGQYFSVDFECTKIEKNIFEKEISFFSKDLSHKLKNQKKLISSLQKKLLSLHYDENEYEMVYDEKLKQNIPSSWEVKKLKDCIEKVSTGLNPRNHFKLGDGDIKYVTVKNLDIDGNIDFSNCDVINEKARKLIHARSDISVGDILYASICPLGRCYLIKDKIKNWDINESVFSIRANKEVVTPEYLYMIFKHEAVIKKLTNAATGSIFKGIRINDLLNIYIPIPDKETMDKISENIKCILELQRNIYSNAKELSDISDLILPLIMSGQVK